MLAKFVIKNNFQKGGTYRELLSDNTLSDICFRVTGQREFEVEFNNLGYNKGRLAKLEYDSVINYVFLTEVKVDGRNYYFQSFLSTFNQYLNEEKPNKRLYLYFLTEEGDFETSYFTFMYRLLKTVGTIFLNENEHLSRIYPPFTNVLDVINQRENLRRRNPANKSTIATISNDNILQIFAKTYGANKYESLVFAFALTNISSYPIEIYEIQENGLISLPNPGRQLLINKGANIIISDISFERISFYSEDSLRSPTYIYNLLAKLGEKKCSLCNCDIPQIIQGAHIWSVSNIKNDLRLSADEKLYHATNVDNGLWLCSNHHKLFDSHLISINTEGRIFYNNSIIDSSFDYLLSTLNYTEINPDFINENFIQYLDNRNINFSNYVQL